ncbi:MAG TPA: GNAT family N-acetyltransferase [Solirubrobacteraceae bacterium]
MRARQTASYARRIARCSSYRQGHEGAHHVARGHNHEAIIALDQRDGDGIGVARYVRDPMRPDTGEVAVTVVDEWQGRGLGTLLLDVLSVRARQEGIRTFTALMLARNEQMMDLFQQLGPVRIVGRGAGTVEIEVAIPDPRTLSDHRP